MNIIETHHLTKTYAGFTAVSDLNLHIPKGTVYGFLGPNGAGKSTLLKALCRQLPYRGTCRLNSRMLTDFPLRKLAGAVSYIPQRSGISISLPLIDVVLMGFNPDLKLLERPSPKQQEKARRALAAAGRAGKEMEDYLTLSEGQKQLCILARTIVENTSLLLLDEPDSALDFHNKHRMMQILQRLTQDQEKAALICLHDPNLALDYCDQLLLLKDGRCFTSLHPAADSLAQMQEALSKIYGSVSLVQCRDEQNRTRLVLLSRLQTGGEPDAADASKEIL